MALAMRQKEYKAWKEGSDWDRCLEALFASAQGHTPASTGGADTSFPWSI